MEHGYGHGHQEADYRQGDDQFPWDGHPLGMPGRSQHGQLLNPDDDGSEATDSEPEREPPRPAAPQAVRQEQRVPVQQPPAAAPAAPKPRAGGDESGTDTDEDGELIKAKEKAAEDRAKAPPPPLPPLPKKRSAGKPRAGAGITLGLLIKEGLLWPGEDVLSVEYKSVMTYATLTPEGTIVCKINGSDATFESPSAFSIFLKRMVNPARKADDGWKTVKFNGRFLETYKLELAKRRMAAAGDGEEEAPAEPAAKKARTEAAPGQAGGKPPPKPKAPRKAANGHSAPAAKAVVVGSNLEDTRSMIPCERFRGEPGGPGSACQPFRVLVSSAAALFMDFHAHLSDNEVCGLLGGSWDAGQRLLRVERALRVAEVQTAADTHTVEMEAGDEAAVSRTITQQHNLRVVGWYHSHPHAATHPSTADIMRQIALQKAHRDEASGAEPFVGAILGPWQQGGEGPQGRLAWFCVEHPRGRALPPGCDPIAEGCLPMEVQVEEGPAPDADIAALLANNGSMRLTAQRCAAMSRRAGLTGAWPGGGTRLARLLAALDARLPAAWPPKRRQDFLTRTDAIVAAAWKVFGNKPPAAKEEEDLEISDVTGEKERPGRSAAAAAAVADDASTAHAAHAAHGQGAAANGAGTGGGGGGGHSGLEEPAAHTLFEHGSGARFGGGGLGDDGLLGGDEHYRDAYNDDEDISE